MDQRSSLLDSSVSMSIRRANRLRQIIRPDVEFIQMPCLHGGGITLLEGLPFKKGHLCPLFFLFPLHKRRDNPGVGITLPACWGYPSRRDSFLFVQAM